MQPKKGEISPFSISKNSSNFVVAIEAYPQPLPKEGSMERNKSPSL